MSSCFFFFNDTATTEIYTLSLHDALPISPAPRHARRPGSPLRLAGRCPRCSARWSSSRRRSEEHTSELQSRLHLVCRLLLEKKKITTLQQIHGHQHQRFRCPTSEIREVTG